MGSTPEFLLRRLVGLGYDMLQEDLGKESGKSGRPKRSPTFCLPLPLLM